MQGKSEKIGNALKKESLRLLSNHSNQFLSPNFFKAKDMQSGTELGSFNDLKYNPQLYKCSRQGLIVYFIL